MDVRIPQGGSCTLECQAPGKPLPEVKWTRGGKEIKPSENLIIESSADGQHKLTISNAQADLTGQYVANVKHKLRTQQMVFNVLVTGLFSSWEDSDNTSLLSLLFILAPLTLKEPARDVNVIQSQNAQITLDIDGLPRPTVTWLFNGTPISPSGKYKVETKGNQVTLNVIKTDLPDSGIYTAIIDNGLEKLEVPVKMAVGGKTHHGKLHRTMHVYVYDFQ